MAFRHIPSKPKVSWREHVEPHARTRRLGHRCSVEYYMYTDLDDTPDDRVFSGHEYYELPKGLSVWIWAAGPSKLFNWRIRIGHTDFGDYESLRLAVEALPKCLRRLRKIKESMPKLHLR